jgi:hypothetical protein
MTRKERIHALAGGIAYPDVTSELLRDTPEAERQAIVDEALELAFTERAAHRDVILRERLAVSSPDGWGVIFAENPALKDELTDEQRERWEAWRAGTRAPEPNHKILTMRRPQ